MEYFSHCDLDEEKTGSSYGILNCSPLTLLDSKVLQENLVTPLQWRYFASDRVYDYPFFSQLRDTYQLKEYDWTDKNLAEILSFIKKSEI